MTAENARQAAEQVARVSYGRLLAIIAAGNRDIVAAEDALSDAFAAALRTWPERGVPDNPEAWLLTAARNARRHVWRHDSVRQAALLEVERRLAAPDEVSDGFPDERLKLLFVCAHPAIDIGSRTPLMLQCVLGLDAARIARAFVVSPATMGQRLVRAKAKIRDAGIRFEVPDPRAQGDRLEFVLDAIYAAFGTAWDDIAGGDSGAGDLAEEALFLGRLLVALLPEEPEARGLLALMLYCHARRAARRDEAGRFVPLQRQDARLWDADRIAEAERELGEAARRGRFGRYQGEAAIQSVHVQRPISGRVDHAVLAALYDMLAMRAPSLGVLVGRAANLLQMGATSPALDALEAIDPERGAAYQPYWVTRAHVLTALGRRTEAAEALAQAIALTGDPAVRDHLSTTDLSRQ